MLAVLLSLIGPAHADDEPPPDEPGLIQVVVGKSVLLTLPRTPRSVAVTDPSIAAVQTLGTPTTLLLQGRAVGTTDLVINLGGAHAIRIHDVEVVRDLGGLRRMIEHVTDKDADAPDPDDRPPRVE